MSANEPATTQTATTGAPPTETPPAETRPTAPAYVEQADEQVNKSGVDKPDLPSCPSCTVGVLYPIVWDPNATHEIGQPIYAPQLLSGGAVQLLCFACGFQESRSMNPQPAPVNPNPGA